MDHTKGLEGDIDPDDQKPPPEVRVEIFVDASNFHPALEESGIGHPVAFGLLAQELTSAVGGTTLVALHYVGGVFREPHPRDPHLVHKPGEYQERLGRFRDTKRLFDRVEQEPGVRVWRETFIYRTPDEKDSRPIIEKGTDIRTALLMYEGAEKNRYDVAVLVASDADFGPAVEMVKALGKRVVWAYTSAHQTMKALVKKGAERLELTPEMLERCRYLPADAVGSARSGRRGRI
jgi:uncharacterized LabA/DUF88 family protein